MSNSNPQGGNSCGSYVERFTCAKCGKKYNHKCLADTIVFVGCGKSGHQLKYCPPHTTRGRDDKAKFS